MLTSSQGVRLMGESFLASKLTETVSDAYRMCILINDAMVITVTLSKCIRIMVAARSINRMVTALSRKMVLDGKQSSH